MRILVRRLAVCVLVSLGCVAAASDPRSPSRPAALQPPGCTVDPETGLLAPERVPGVCVQETASGVALVAATRDGVLIVSSDSRRAQDDGSSIRVDDDVARVVYCAARTACVLDAATLAPGTGALVGRARAKAYLTPSAGGAAACPSTLEVVGTVSGPRGGTFGLSAALALSRTGMGCAVVNDAVELVSESATSLGAGLDAFETELDQRLRRLAEIDPARWELIESLVRLGDEDWRLLQWMLALNGEELAQLGRFMESGGAPEAWGGLVLPEGASLDRGGGPDDDAVLPAGIMQDIFSRLGTLLNRISFSLPNNGAVRNLFTRIDVSVVIDLLNNVKEQIGGVLGMLEEIRAGFDDWRSDACGAGCGVTDFKGRLTRLFADLDALWCDTQHLACLTNPDLVEPRHLRGFRQGELFHKLIVEKPPAIFLYALHRVLENVDGWDTAIADVRDQLPESLGQVCSGCTGCECASDESSAMSLPAAQDVLLPHEVAVCEILRPDPVGKAVEDGIRRLGLAMFVFDIVEAWTPDNNTYGVEVTAVGGGGATLTVKNPPDGMAKSVNKVLKLFKDGLEQAKAMREACVRTEKTIESQLGSCSPPRELFTQLLAFDDLARMQYWVERWIGEALLNPDVHGEIDLPAAECFVARSLDVTKGRRARFTDLCDAYQLLVAGEVRQNACGVAPPRGNASDAGDSGLVRRRGIRR